MLTPFVSSERLSLLGLIILGEGFNGVGEQLNKLSPGYKVVDTQGVQTEAGGWSGFTILQICSTVALIVLLFWGYFRRATKHFPAPRLLALVWAYLHIVIHAASAVVVVGMKRCVLLVARFAAGNYADCAPNSLAQDHLSWQYVRGVGSIPGESAALSTARRVSLLYGRDTTSLVLKLTGPVAASGPPTTLPSLINTTNRTYRRLLLSSWCAPTTVLESLLP